MDQEEKLQILRSARLLEEYENTPRTFNDPYAEMSDIEKSKLIIYLQELLEEQKRQVREQREIASRERARADQLMSKLDDMTKQFSELLQLLKAQEKENAQLKEELAKVLKAHTALSEQQKLDRKNRYGSKSQKGIGRSKQEEKSREEDKGDFDGTAGSVGSTTNVTAAKPEQDPKIRTERQKMADMMRHGTAYRTMKAVESVKHVSDLGKLPQGAEFVKTVTRYAYEQTVRVVEHEYHLVTYRLNGVMYTAYLPAEGEPEVIDRVPGTKASADFLAYLSFNHFFLNTPLYREVKRLRDEGMRVSRMTLTNWLYKGAKLLSGIVDELKKMALERDSVIHCDETWCRVKVYNNYRKRYIWCLVNREARIAIYCYEDGSRGRDALKSIIEGKELKALQTDGYNVYMYLDDEMIDIEHICCMAHARAKFLYALEQSGDLNAKYILECIAQLYALEETYVGAGLTNDEITKARQGLKTKEIIGRIRSKMDVLLADNHPPRGELMEKAVRHLDNFWKQIFAYTRDGRYSIDNNIAERCIRPLTGERKNSLSFGSHRMARASAIYHTVIATCQMNKIPVLEYLKKCFRKKVKDYIQDDSGFLPQNIGVEPCLIY